MSEIELCTWPDDFSKAADREACLALLLDADPSREHVEEYLARGELYVLRDAANRTLAGVYVLIATRPATCEIVNIAVVENKRGQGLGKRLLEHARETARARGARQLEIGTGNSSVDQLALYQKFGFRIVGVDLDFFTRMYDEPIIENGIACRDMIRLSMQL